MSLTQEQIDFFALNGYVAYGPMLDAAEVAELREEYDRVFAEAERDGRFRNLSGDAGSGEAPQRMLQIMQMCERSLPFRRLLYHPRILDAVQSLLGPNLMLFHDQALYKPARTGGPILWHQDNAYWRCAPANLVSCWLTLDDVDEANGAMQVIPGSHLRPVHHETSVVTNALLESNLEGREAEAHVVELPAGGCMFHHCQTLHHTAPNRTERPRRAFAIHFMPPGTRDRNGEILRVSFAHPMLRACL
jgi:ectoine hydroxylase-related dioxygenase (phytanoyl-CoA dioxygenase family)